MSALIDRYYRNSGAVPFSGMLRMLALGGLAATILSLVYSLATYYLPSVKLHFVLTIGFGVLMGFVVRQCALAGKIRNRAYCSLVGLAIGVLTLYTAWVWFLWILFGYQVFVFDPAGILSLIQAFGENGLWEMNGRMVGKWELYGAWIFEAATILIASTVTAASIDKPFCEHCQAWTEAADQLALLPLADEHQLRQDLEYEEYAALVTPRAADFDPADCLHATVMKCPHCRDTTFLTVARVVITPTKDGQNVQRTEFIKHLIVPREVTDRLLAGPEPDSLQDYLPATAEEPTVRTLEQPAIQPEGTA